MNVWTCPRTAPAAGRARPPARNRMLRLPSARETEARGGLRRSSRGEPGGALRVTRGDEVRISWRVVDADGHTSRRPGGISLHLRVFVLQRLAPVHEAR